MAKKLIAVEEELLPKIRELTKGDSVEPTVLQIAPDSVVVFNVQAMVRAVGRVRASSEIRSFSGAMSETIKRDLGITVPVICVTDDEEIRSFPPEYMLNFGWVQVPEGVEDPEARQAIAKLVLDRLSMPIPEWRKR